MSANIHLLLHLTNNVCQLGPLWVYSCFYFEGKNGVLKNSVHGTQYIEKQIINSLSYYKNLPVAAEKFLDDHGFHFEAFKHLHCNYRNQIPINNSLKIAENVYVLGKAYVESLNEAEMQALHVHIYGDNSPSIEIYYRMLFHNIPIHSCNWNKKGYLKQNNSTIAYTWNQKTEYGILKRILILNKSRSVFIVAKLDSVAPLHTHEQSSIPHILACSQPGENLEVKAITVENIRSPCVFMSFKDVKDTI